VCVGELRAGEFFPGAFLDPEQYDGHLEDGAGDGFP
jgi:hypothetical protein